ncbi:hypothetical protein R3P38DRAFT_2761540 [Favolaschia claudopus]|uniref:Uncharacterized protein n=1 Tax=Favolaschia claudopus TaxID=2862362 RepID=A0AAW0DRV3_9AGAR
MPRAVTRHEAPKVVPRVKGQLAPNLPWSEQHESRDKDFQAQDQHFMASSQIHCIEAWEEFRIDRLGTTTEQLEPLFKNQLGLRAVILSSFPVVNLQNFSLGFFSIPAESSNERARCSLTLRAVGVVNRHVMEFSNSNLKLMILFRRLPNQDFQSSCQMATISSRVFGGLGKPRINLSKVFFSPTIVGIQDETESPHLRAWQKRY